MASVTNPPIISNFEVKQRVDALDASVDVAMTGFARRINQHTAQIARLDDRLAALESLTFRQLLLLLLRRMTGLR